MLESEWYNSSCNIVTYQLSELIATKLRALYQRRKGRDLFDIWYVIKRDLVKIEEVIDIFQRYCANDGVKISRELFQKNIELKKLNKDFQVDMQVLLPHKTEWDFETAYNFVLDKVVNKLP